MIVQDDIHSLAGERIDGEIQNFQRTFSPQCGIGCDRVVGDHRVGFHEFVGPRDADAIEAHGLHLVRDGGERLVRQAPHRELGVIRAVPIHARQFDAMALRIHDPTMRGMERQFVCPRRAESR